MRSVVVALVVATVSSCSSKTDAPSASIAAAPSTATDLPEVPSWLHEPIVIAIHATRIVDGGTPSAIYAVPASREASGVVRVMSGLADRYVLANKDTGAHVPWLFGSDDKNVTEKLTLRLEASEVDASNTAIAIGDAPSQLGKVIADARAMTSLPLSVSLVVENAATFKQLADVLDTIARNNVASVTITLLGTHQWDGPPAGTRGRQASAPTLSIGKPTVDGDLDEAIVRRYLKRNLQKLQYCYEKQLLTTPAVEGAMVLNFTIKPDGTVRNAKVTAPTQQIAACATSVVNGIEYPKPPDGASVSVSYPITLHPGG